MTMIANQLHTVRSRIAAACLAAGRDQSEVSLLAVSKTFGPEAVAEAFAAGQTAFGENYIQEAVEKMALLRHLPLQWHCIGPVQSNKTRLVAEHFDWVHTVDRLKIALRLSEQRPEHLPPLQVCLQVNVDGGASKSGAAPIEALALAREVAALPRLKLRGLMCIPEPAPVPGHDGRPGGGHSCRQHPGAGGDRHFWRACQAGLRAGPTSQNKRRCVEFLTSSITA
jgi:pyridoxal phosphate enzyme (YggS family)